MAHAHEELCLLVQVEAREALHDIEAIPRVEGVDGIFIGPADLSASLRHPGNPRHPEVDEARARRCLDLSAQFVAVAVELLALRGALYASVARCVL